MFPIISQCGYFIWSMAANSVVCSPIRSKIKLNQDIMHFLLIWKLKMERINSNRDIENLVTLESFILLLDKDLWVKPYV